MPKFLDNKPKNHIINIIYDTLYKRLDDIGVPEDCDTRKMSWDEAANECWGLSREQETNLELIYVTAIQLYLDASKLWEAIEDCDEIFKGEQ